MQNWKVLSVVAAVAIVAFLLLPASAEDDAPPLDPERFDGKVAVIYVRNAVQEDAIMIRSAEFERISGRWFLTGACPDLGEPEDWMADAEAAVDWARVESFILLSEEQFQQRLVAPGGGRVLNAL